MYENYVINKNYYLVLEFIIKACFIYLHVDTRQEEIRCTRMLLKMLGKRESKNYGFK